MPARATALAVVAIAALAGVVALGSIACQRSDRLGFTKPAPATPEELLAELKTHQERIDQATDGMMKRIQEFNTSRQPGQRTIQFSEIFTQTSDAQRDVRTR
jgi:hypothetical protein